MSGGRARVARVVIDLQRDSLRRPGLAPDVASLCARTAVLPVGVRRTRIRTVDEEAPC